MHETGVEKCSLVIEINPTADNVPLNSEWMPHEEDTPDIEGSERKEREEKIASHLDQS